MGLTDRQKLDAQLAAIGMAIRSLACALQALPSGAAALDAARESNSDALDDRRFQLEDHPHEQIHTAYLNEVSRVLGELLMTPALVVQD